MNLWSTTGAAMPLPPPTNPPLNVGCGARWPVNHIQHWEGGGRGWGVVGGREGGAWANLELIARCTCSGWVIIAIFFLHILLCVGNKPIKFHKDWPSGLPIKNYTIRCYELQDTLWQIYFDQDCLSRGRTLSTKLVISPKRLQIHAPYFTGIMLTHMHIYTSKIEEFIQSKLALCLIEFDFCLRLPTFWHC